ncbi:prolyl 4-hydroxylase subunit alpha-1-like [Ochlerotatus camptorhynchus]|uniref:prolyl 4-hydroxylase subunit alpha-1-like n=1 Tax=Ochlerotatus camptorhynchus TaxID=644619 RepID=UPI0031D026FA
MALLDVGKAFDNVWHDGLVRKLQRNNYLSIHVVEINQENQRSQVTTLRYARCGSERTGLVITNDNSKIAIAKVRLKPLQKAAVDTKPVQFSDCYAVITLVTTLVKVKSHLFTALSELDQMIQTEGVILEKLNHYIRLQEERLNHLRWKRTQMLREHNKAIKQPEEYLFNPVNAFLLIKRLTKDWSEIQQLITYEMQRDFMGDGTNYSNLLVLPTEEDLTGAAQALARLQDTYNLDTAVVASGIHAGSEMSFDDCFELGKQLHATGDQHRSVLWLREALNRSEQGTMGVAKKAEALEYLAFYTYLLGNVEVALGYVKDLLEMKPDHENAFRHKVFYEELIQHGQDRKFNINSIPNNDPANIILNSYRKLCRGEVQRNASETSNLKCRYVTSGSAFTRLAPLKLEEVHILPRIVLYHNVLSDNEIQVLKRIAKPRFKRATVLNHETGDFEPSNYRISKSAWLADQDDPIVNTISKRVADMTGLSTDTAEELHVVNYGLGGQYHPHFDFFQTDKVATPNNGNRIATVLFYLSDVSHGGATVFPKIGVTLKPRKGSAAVWYNLHSSGDLDFSTAHGACPVLIGSKWVANKWLRERGQEFRRKCDSQSLVENNGPKLRHYMS